MEHKERVNRFKRALLDCINYHISEYNLTYSEIIGTLEMEKANFINDWLNVTEETNEG